MGTIKKMISLGLVAIFTMYIVLNGVQVNAVINRSTVNIDIKAATLAVEKAEKLVSTVNFNSKVAQSQLNVGVKSVQKIKGYGKSYAANFNKLNARLKIVTAKIQKKILADKTKADKIKADKKMADKVLADKAIADKAADKAVGDKSATTPQAVSINPDSNKKSFNIHAFYSGNTKYDNNTESYINSLSSISFAWLDLKYENGNVILDGNDKGIDFHIPQDYDKPLSICKANNIPAQIAIFSDGNTAKAIMSDNTLREALIKKIVENLSIKMLDEETFDFSGVVIDFEGFRNNDTSEYFNSFLSELKTSLATLNKKAYLYVAVNVRSYWPGYDYKEILKYADKVVLMAHDYAPSSDLSKGDILKYINYNSDDPILSLAPINNVRTALEDLISSISSIEDKSKIWLQISFGIAQWQFSADSTDSWKSFDSSVIGSKANPTYDMLQNRLSNQDKLATDMYMGYINELQSPYLTYYNLQSGTYNFILYEDSRSIEAKIDLAKLEGIDGISLWRLGNMPDINGSLGENYNMNVWSEILEAEKQ